MLHAETRTNLHRIAAHVVGRRRHAVTGKFGLRATPGGFGTPAFGDPVEVVRTSGVHLIHEVGPDVRSVSMAGATLRTLASFVGADIEADFSVGADTPAIANPDEPIDLDARALDDLARWFQLGWIVLDRFVAGLGPDGEPAVTQLWPEHFDAGTSVTVGPGQRANLGFSPGDGFEEEPYAYFGPWEAGRPGDPSYWNAPFGAFLRRDEIVTGPDPVRRVADFFDEGVRLIRTA